MNLPPDIIFRLLLILILSIIVLRMLWPIIQNFLENKITGKQNNQDLNNLIEQQKHRLFLSTPGSNKERDSFLAKIQWGDQEILETLQIKIEQELNSSLSIEEIKKALIPLKQSIGKREDLNHLNCDQCFNLCLYLLLHHHLQSSGNFQLPHAPMDFAIKQHPEPLGDYLQKLTIAKESKIK